MYVDELADYDQQVVQWQQQRLAKFDRDGFLPRRQRGGRLMRPMRAVIRVIAPLPFARRGHADVVRAGKLCLRSCAAPDFRSQQQSRSGLGVYLTHCGFAAFSDSIEPAITSQARKNGELQWAT